LGKRREFRVEVGGGGKTDDIRTGEQRSLRNEGCLGEKRGKKVNMDQTLRHTEQRERRREKM